MFYVDDIFPTWLFLIIVASILLVGLILFLCNGFLFIGKGRVGVIERIGNYVGTYKKGLYYFTPLLYRRVGYYKVGETLQRFRLERKQYQIKYEIKNYKTWHYVGHHDVLGIVSASLKEKDADLSKLLIERFSLVGVRFISLEIIKK